MITEKSQGVEQYETTYTFYCLSTDPSPYKANMAGDSKLIEKDTGKLFYYNEQTKKWIDPIDNGAERPI